MDQFDPVNRPAHYAQDRRYEVVNVLEDWVAQAPDPVSGALLWNTCKYLGRCWCKHDDPMQDLHKARWYLDRLIAHLERRAD